MLWCVVVGFVVLGVIVGCLVWVFCVWFGFFVFGLGFLCLVFCDNVGIMVTLTIWAKRLFIENTYILIGDDLVI